MQVRLTAEFRCCPDGRNMRTFPAGEIVTGRVADWALGQGAGAIFDPRTEAKVVHPPETKKRGRRK